MSPSPLRALLVDDERLARKYLRQLLAEHADVSVVGEAGTVAAAAALAAELRPDVIFLDVQMPPASGFDLLPLLSPAPAIVFVTAHDQFALRAFAASAADYLLKPVAPERLALSLHHARQGRIPPAAVSSAPVAAPTPLGLDDTLILRDTGRLCRVRLGDIAAIVAEGGYTHVHLAAERSLFIPRSMNTWASQLPAPPFLRADRSLFVNLSRIARLDIRSRDDGQLTLDAASAPTLPLRRVALAQIRVALAG